ncbi:hypothetical protein F2P81_006816 [Scophthalmus maximus]|uniref:Uncharacterized protein n=1 Tax=Scophthalmus maximus TaxID=52904 RepID=A0A6A4T967_SCOMX|nr:hypothetical protein F2P81_006816 [Scophthalmus maximus]
MKLWNNANCSVTLQRGGGASSGLISSGLSGGSWEKKKKKKRKVVNTVKERCRPFGGWMKIQHDSGGNDAQTRHRQSTTCVFVGEVFPLQLHRNINFCKLQSSLSRHQDAARRLLSSVRRVQRGMRSRQDHPGTHMDVFLLFVAVVAEHEP